MNKFYNKVKKLGLRISHVAEVGVWHPRASNVLDFIANGCRADLFEADPMIVRELEEYFKGKKNVKIFPYAIYDRRGKIGLYRLSASTFIKELDQSPALINDKYKPNEADLFFVEARLLSDFDDGSIDLLSIDTEGSEWQVIQHLKSRPLVISIETHGQRYRNPFRKEITQWMKDNNYKKWYWTRSDSVYIIDRVKIGFFDKIFSAFKS